MRLFFALWPPPAAARALEQWAGALDGRAIPAAKLHLTLAFLGEADPQRAGEAARRVEARRHALPLEQVGYWRHNRIVWAGPRETPPELVRLAEALRLELFRAQFYLERRPFAAHVTLARKARAPRELAPLPALAWPVEELLLVRSTLAREGPAYEVLERFPLAGV